ncbi:acanthoscurrin-1 [Anabrus simplex]|uniref:acanthoscurrin-1 n=1 Tax=Anabrus simplex TaxID=316456 RepID=UPI0035A28448
MKLILCTVFLLTAAVLSSNGATIEGRSGRNKRELCKWFGNLACTAMCKIKVRGSTQGICTGGSCGCVLPNSYGGTGVVYPGANGIGFGGTNGIGFGGTNGNGFGGTNGIGFGGTNGIIPGGTNGMGYGGNNGFGFGGNNGFGYGYTTPTGFGYGGNGNVVTI